MTLLSHLPCLWVAPNPAPAEVRHRMTRHLPDYFRIAPGDTKAMGKFLARETSDHVLILRADFLPLPSLPLYVPDPLLLQSGLSFRFLARNSVTAGFDDRNGPIICRRDGLLASLAIPEPDAVVPVALGDWHCNPTAEAAFSAGFETVRHLPPREASLSASLGADAPHGLAWCLGALWGLRPSTTLPDAWLRDGASLVDPATATRRISELARLLRVDHGIDVRPLSPGESRLAKAVSAEWPPARMFHAIAQVYEGLGPEGTTIAQRYRLASLHIWGQKPAVETR